MPSKAVALRELLETKKIVRIVGAHNAMGAKLVERNGFEGVWASGLELSASHGVPDANILTMTENLEAAQSMNDAVKIPVVCDCDTGYGNASNVIHMVRKYEAAGLAAVVIEDKRFPKVNSFIPGRQELAPINEFCGKLEAARNVRKDPSFCIFARIEAFIAGWGLDEALTRADAYEEAGADAIVIHSKIDTPAEIFQFAEKWRGTLPLVAIPTTYYRVTGDELALHKFKMVIYANHGLRASLKAMNETMRDIAKSDSTEPVESKIASMKHVFDIQGMASIKNDEKKFSKRDILHAIIPAASDYKAQPELKSLLNNKPLPMLNIAGKTLLERQMNLLRSGGITDIHVVGGYQFDQLKAKDAHLINNPCYKTSHSAQSVLCAETCFENTCIILYSDIIFDRSILDQLLDSPHDLTLVIDRAYQTLPSRAKKLDLVTAATTTTPSTGRKLEPDTYRRITQIGKRIDQKKANYEFIGLLLMKKNAGIKISKCWQEACDKFKDQPFHEAKSGLQASFTDLVQHLIDCDYPVYGMEISHGWSEVHSVDDVDRINAYFQNTTKEPSTLR